MAFIARMPLTLMLPWCVAHSVVNGPTPSEANCRLPESSASFITLPLERVISIIHPENVPSQKVAARAGETKGQRIALEFAGKDYPADIWAITRAEWEAKRRG